MWLRRSKLPETLPLKSVRVVRSSHLITIVDEDVLPLLQMQMEEIITVMPPAAEIALEDFNYQLAAKV
jgi:hypothetical protein